MSWSPQEIQELEEYFSKRTRDPGAPQVTGFPYPEIIPGVSSTGGGNFSASDLLATTQYQKTGQFPAPPIVDGPPGTPGSIRQGPPAPSGSVGEPMQLASASSPMGPGELSQEDLDYLNNDYQFGATPAEPMASEESFDEIDTSRLQGQLGRQREEVERLTGEKPPVEKESTLNKVFDILSRPNFAIASATMNATDEDDSTSVWEGLKEGFTGRSKNTFADFMEQEGIENKVARGLGGFVLDVGLDPTTYLGLGLVKSAGKGAIKAAGLKAANEVMTNPANIRAATEMAENSRRAQLAQNLLKGKKSGVKTETGINREIQANLRSVAADARKAAEKELRDAGKGRVDFKFAGKNIGSSEKLYSGISKATRPIRENPAVDALNHMLRPVKELGEVHGLHRIHEGMSIANYEKGTRHWRDMTSHLNKTQAAKISNAIEGTTHLDDPDLLKIKEQAEAIMRGFAEDEVALGILKPEQLRDNYIYHVYNVGDDVSKAYKTRASKSSNQKFGPGQERKHTTLDQAKKDGMKPIEDIRELVLHRAEKHYKEVARRSFYEDAIQNFGIKVGGKERKQVDKFLKGIDSELEEVSFYGQKALFPKPIAESLKYLDTIAGNDRARNTLLRHFDKVQHTLKGGMTVYNPGHHARNMTGDIYLNYLDGVRNPKRYADAFKAVQGDRAKIGSEAYEAARNTMVRIGGGASSLEEINDLYKLAGLKSGFFNAELGRSKVTNKAQHIVREASERREETARVAHFIDALKKEKPKNWGSMGKMEKVAIARKVGNRVRKYNLDYGDLTQFEKDVARRAMMFYTFARKNLPLQIEMLAMKPGKVLNVKKGTNAIQEMLGTTEHEDPEWEDRIPKWIRDMQAPQLGGNDNLLQRLLDTNNPVFSTMQLPVNDLNRLEGPRGIAQQITSEARPELKMLAEFGTGAQAFSGAPVGGGFDYAAQTLPITNLLRKAAKKDSTNGMGKDVFNWLTGAGIQEVTEQRQQSELRRRQDPIQQLITEARRKNTEEFQEEIRRKRGG